MGDDGKWERVRRLRYGHVLKLIRFRYGAAGVPDDEAGRPDLMELIWLACARPSVGRQEGAQLHRAIRSLDGRGGSGT